jgi:pimeloyl-ACP methyl ester carboxylesterase
VVTAAEIPRIFATASSLVVRRMIFNRLLVAWRQPALLLGCAMVLIAGCTPTQFVEVRHTPENRLNSRLNRSWGGAVNPSNRTAHFLSSTDYHGPSDSAQMIAHCLRQQRQPERFANASHALAELQYLAADAVRSRDPQLAMELYLDACHDAWKYFRNPSITGASANPADPDHRDTAETYNASAEQLLRLIRQHLRISTDDAIHLPLTGRRLTLEIPSPSRQFAAEAPGEFEFVSDYRVLNLRTRHTTAGLGVPVVINRTKQRLPEPLEKYYTSSMTFPGTLVLSFPENVARPRDIRLQLFDPRESENMVIGDHLAPLETDISTPLARQLSNRDLSLLDTWALIRPDLAQQSEGLYMVQPYDPDRIPVLMIHGFWSSPMTWMEMFNDLQADPEIRRRYQFWFYLYPTGEPVAFSAARLRETLKQVRRECDPEMRNPKLDEMVVVGHSMGGILAHSLTINSGESLWSAVSQQPISRLRADPETREALQQVFYFEANPSVDRVVTIASPYAGSTLSNRFTRWALGSVIWLPTRTMKLSRVLFEHAPEKSRQHLELPRTSIDSLSPKSAILRLVRGNPIPQPVHHHNIVAVNRGRNADTWTDGVVTWKSSHLDDVDSERVIQAGHSEVVRSPETVREIRRILFEHIAQIDRRRIPVIPATQTVETQPTNPTEHAVRN